MKQSHLNILLVIVGLTSSFLSASENKSKMEECYLKQIDKAQGEVRIAQIKKVCAEKVTGDDSADDKQTPLERRIVRERQQIDNPNVITPHKRNYMMPVTYMRTPNEEPFLGSSYENNLDNLEAKFQLSFKAPIAHSLLSEHDLLFFGFTLQSYWQMYNSEVSSPFRETNYQPEIFYGFLNDFHIGDWTNRVNIIGFEHQSNGRTQPRSRSWNRLYAQFIWENDRWIMGFKPWYRIPESDKDDPTEANGDDNPDIYKYMGYFEFSSAYKWDDQTFGIVLRNNLRSDNRGAVQLDWTFPMGTRFKGYAQYFNGYGESMIDYDKSVERIGIGVLLTDFF